MKRALALGAVTGLLAFGVAPAAQAGEVTGGKDPKPTPISRDYTGEHKPSPSECAFSGLDDVDEGEGEIPEGETEPTPDDFGRTQSYGQIIAMNGAVRGAFTPATSGCNKNAPAEHP